MSNETYNYTIFLPQKDYQKVFDIAEKNIPDFEIEINGDNQNWKNIILTAGGKKIIKLTSMERIEPGDKYSGIILGTYTWIKDKTSSNNILKDKLLKKVAGAELIIGIVSATDIFDRICKPLTSQLDACLFDGNDIYDEKGDVL